MSAVRKTTVKPSDAVGLASNGLGLLENGERLRQPEFHRRYEQYPDDVKIELIGGTVFMASPARFDHGDYDGEIGYVFRTYKAGTPGVRTAGNVTVILGPDDEPQPDQVLMILPERGGRCSIDRKGYCRGAPELIAEVAWSSRSLDLTAKKDRYQSAGVREYLVFEVEQGEMFWHDMAAGGMIQPGKDGIAGSNAFPGLWLNVPALIARDTVRLAATLRLGMATPEHARFVKRLARTKRTG